MFCSGALFFLISIFRIREYVINAIPKNLKLAISAGVGLFLGIIALEEAEDRGRTSGDAGDARRSHAVAGDPVPVRLRADRGVELSRKVVGGTLIGMLVVTAIGVPLGLANYSGVVSMPPSLAPDVPAARFLARVRA